MRDAVPAPRRAREDLLAVFAGGVIGGLLRGALAESVVEHADQWPWPTFTVNVAAAFVLGYAIARLAPGRLARSFLAAGLCGTLSTFSTMMLELLRMIDGAHLALAGAYAGASILCGSLAVLLGRALGRRGWVDV